MKMGKDIDSIYRTRFKEAGMSPPEDSWENILSQLPQKEQKRRLFPFWLKYAGVAAFMALLLAVYLQDSSSLLKERGGFATSPIQKWHFRAPDVSESFKEIMKESEIMLQALMLQHREYQLQEERQHLVSAGAKTSEAKEPAAFQNSVVSISGSEMEDTDRELAMEVSGEGGDSKNEVLPELSDILKEEAVTVAPKNDEFQEKLKLSTRVAPVYFNNFGKGGALDQGISQKQGSGDVTFSYGVSVAYSVAKNVNIRSGINKVDLEYTTRNISFKDIAALGSFAPKMMVSSTLASPEIGSLNQKMGFLEVPLEVEYLLFDKRFSLGVIGGGSLLFLEENELLLDFMGHREDLGEANSMNNLSYSANLGLGVGYNVSNQLQVSMEPLFKFQMNTFKNNGGQRPYFFGLYSGFSYKF